MSSPSLHLHDHPVSSYAQKIRIALREKDIPFTFATPPGLGFGDPIPSLQAANPRNEVPALEDGNDVKIFDSVVIMAYLEEKYAEKKKLLPEGPVERARARMIEEVCGTQYEAINWAYGEIAWSGRASGTLLENLTSQVRHQTNTILTWLTEKLGEAAYFHGDDFGYADVCVAPFVNRSVFYGFGPEKGSALQEWHARVRQRDSVRETFEEAEKAARGMAEGGLKKVFIEGGGRREYRDHRLEWLVKSGGIEVVLEGLRRGNVRFSWPEAAVL